MLDFFRLIDETGSLSLSNIAMMVVITRIATTQNFSLAEAALLLPVIGAYSYKRFQQRRQRYGKEKSDASLATTLSTMGEEIARLKLTVGYKASGQKQNNIG